MKNDRGDENIDPKLLAILKGKEQQLDDEAFLSQLMQRIEKEETVLLQETQAGWFKPAALGSATLGALAIAAPSLADVGMALTQFAPDSYLDLGKQLGVAAVAAGALLIGLAPVANSLGEALARGARQSALGRGRG